MSFGLVALAMVKPGHLISVRQFVLTFQMVTIKMMLMWKSYNFTFIIVNFDRKNSSLVTSAGICCFSTRI